LLNFAAGQGIAVHIAETIAIREEINLRAVSRVLRIEIVGAIKYFDIGNLTGCQIQLSKVKGYILRG